VDVILEYCMMKFLICLFLIGITAFAAKSQSTISVTNAGYNGNNTTELLARVDKDVLSKNAQLVIMMIGTNDMLNQRNTLTVKQYKENYQRLISLIKKRSRLILMTIPPINADYINQRINPECFAPNGPQSRVDSANAVIKELAEKNKCHLIDLNKVLLACGGSTGDAGSLFQNVANSNINDGVHPTVNGYRVIGAAVAQAVTLLEPKTTSIICFGDSITFGYKMKGAGTVKGDTYPAVLYRALNGNDTH